MRKLSAIIPISAMLSGCAVSPSIPVLGAYFPGWLLCVAGALFVTLVIRAILIKLERTDSLGPPVVVYPLIMIIATILFWIIFFRN